MQKQKSLHSIWAETDKSVIDMMTKKTSRSPSTLNKNESTDDDNSDLESIASSCASFAAVPKEFRPPLQIRTKIERPKLSLNQNKQVMSNQNPIQFSKITAEKPPLLETPKTETVNYKTSSHNAIPKVKRNEIPSKQPENLQTRKHEPAAKNTTNAEKNANVSTHLDVNKKPLHQPPQKVANTPFNNRHMAFQKRPQYKNMKNEIKYEYVEKQQQTVKLNFEMPSNLFYKNGLKIDVKMEDWKQPKNRPVTRKNKNFYYRAKQGFSKEGPTVLYQESSVKWVGSLNGDENSNDVKTSHKISHQENLVKWDSTLNPKYLNTDTECKTGQDSGKVAHQTIYGGIKWDNSLNREDSGSDNEEGIEWTVIQEKKTILSAKKIDNKSHNHKQFNDRYLPNKTYKQNGQKKPMKRYYNNPRNNNDVKPPDAVYQRNIPKRQPTGCKDTDKQINKNDLNHSRNIKHGNITIPHADPQEKNPDTESFIRQCKISVENSRNAMPSLLNDYAKFIANFNEKETADSGKSNSYPVKTDNITLKKVEDQKKSVLHYGIEMSDFIIGSHRALSVFISMFKEWKNSRLELINHFKTLETNLKESSKKFSKYKDMLNIARNGVSIAAAIPLPHVSIAARVISVLTGLFSVFLSTTEKQKAEVEDANDISIAASRDTNASTELYMYGLQCGQQFEETTKVIEEFHLNVGDPVIFNNDSPEMATFIDGIMEYRPRHRIFYKKLHKCFQELLQNSKSEFGKRFCEPFNLYSPDAVDVIGFLDWRFHHEDFNGESVRHELQQIENLLEGNDTSIKELTVRIQNCVAILEDEMKFLEGRVKDISLFEKPEHFGIKTFLC